MRILLTCALLLIATLSHAAVEPGRIVLPAGITPSHYDLELAPNAGAATFEATVGITLTFDHPTADIKLNAADLKFEQVRITDVAGAPAIDFDAREQTATLHFAAPVPAGRHVLSIHYSGLINASAAGLFYLDYAAGRISKRALYTEFENSDARRLLPCWDEPNRKATFTLTVVAPSVQMVVSNMPAARVRRLAGGMARTTFQITPKMSTYLLFLAVGDFERITRQVGAVQIGMVFKRGDAQRARFALDAAAQILPFYEDYFGFAFPLPKLDLVAGPGQSQEFEAMENWGAIFGFERYLLVDPHSSTQADAIETYIDVAHEMAHQWVGDLVTMDWWNDLWLNEGFAEWMQFKAVDHFHPQWQPWLRAAGEREEGMQLDSRTGTHPVITPIADVQQANNAFDAITYNKGMAVIRMLERQMGESAFRDGVRRYIRAHAYGNAVSDDLWQELDRTASDPVTPIAHEFTLQPGVPLIRASGGDALHLEQARFTADGATAPQVWQVPVAVRGTQGRQWSGQVSAAAAVTLPQIAAPGALVNAGQDGYFRTLYAPSLLPALVARFDSLAAADQLGILLDGAALGMAGYEPLPDVLQLCQSVHPGMPPAVQRAATIILADIARLYRGRTGEGLFTQFARTDLSRLLAATGWSPTQGEAADTERLRATLIDALSELDDPQVIARARTLFAGFLRDPDSLDSRLREQVLDVIAAHADDTSWQQLHQLAVNAHSTVEKQRLFEMLGLAHSPILAQRALDLTLTNEIVPTTRPMILNSVAVRHPQLAFDFAIAHRDLVNSWVEPGDHDLFQIHLLAGALDTAALPGLRSYADAHIDAADRGPVEAMAASIADSAKKRDQQLPQVDEWLATH